MKILKLFDTGIPQRGSQRVFLSVLQRHGGYEGVLRQWRIGDGSTSEIRRVLLSPEGKIVSEDRLCEGEDPRVFEWRGGLHALTWMWGNGDWNLYRVDLATGSRTELVIDPPMFRGKNWMPAPIGDRLLIIRSVDPLVVLEASDDGKCSVIYKESDRHIGICRGGGCAIAKNGLLSGFGHKTHSGDHHTVFRFSISVGTWAIDCEDVAIDGLGGMGIVDPTAAWDDKLVVCATPRNWLGQQFVVHALLGPD